MQRPTDDGLKQSPEAMTNHDQDNQVTRISIPKADLGLDRLEWHKMEPLTKKNCAHVNLTMTVYDQKKDEQPKNQDETSERSVLGKAQRQYEALSKLF